MKNLVNTLNNEWKKVATPHGYFEISRIDKHVCKVICVRAYVTDHNATYLPELVNGCSKRVIKTYKEDLPSRIHLTFLDEADFVDFMNRSNALLKENTI